MGHPTRSPGSSGSASRFQRPLLTRCFATSVGGVKETGELRSQIISAFEALPFHGPPIELPCGSEVVKDSWLCALEHELDSYEKTGLDQFDLEAWLAAKVNAEGTDVQRRDFAAFVKSLDDMEGPTIDDSLTPLAMPLREVEVYRDLSDIEVNEDTDDFDDPPADEPTK